MATISSLLADHVTLQVRSVDRSFSQGYVPRLMTEGQVIRFLLDRRVGRSHRRRSLGRSATYVKEINAFAKAREIPVVRFTKDMVKEDVARPHMQDAERDRRSGGGQARSRPRPA